VRLFFDEQLSEDLSELLHDIFPGSLHIRQIGSSGATDATVWQLAKTHECLLVTKDETFTGSVCFSARRRRLSGFGVETAARRKSRNSCGKIKPIFSVLPIKTKLHSWHLASTLRFFV